MNRQDQQGITLFVILVSWIGLALARCTPEVHAGTTCEDRTARALEEIARQERRQADALERLADGRR